MVARKFVIVEGGLVTKVSANACVGNCTERNSERRQEKSKCQSWPILLTTSRATLLITSRRVTNPAIRLAERRLAEWRARDQKG